jgi:hypothetical protein
MFRITVFAAVMVAFQPASIHGAPQGDNLSQQFHNTYVETIMDAGGLKVAKPGSTLVVQVEGVMANPNKNKAAPYSNTFSDGEVKPDTTLSVIKNPFGRLKASSAERALTVGEKVYLLKAEFNADNVAFTVQSCGDCDPKAMDPAHQPFRAKVTFRFLKGALASTDLKHVQQTIEQVFKFPDAADPETEAPADNAGAPPPSAPGQARAQVRAPAVVPPPAEAPPAEPQPQYAAIAPPPPPPAEPRKLKVGMTIQEVKDGFGQPVNIIDLDTKVIYVYKDLKVTFVKGKVSDVDVI